jgi:hypothetical protein
MPMPPPKPTTEASRDPRRRAEVKQLARALRAKGPLPLSELGDLVGAEFWDRGRFDAAVTAGVADGFIVRGRDGRLAAP